MMRKLPVAAYAAYFLVMSVGYAYAPASRASFGKLIDFPVSHQATCLMWDKLEKLDTVREKIYNNYNATLVQVMNRVCGVKV